MVGDLDDMLFYADGTDSDKIISKAFRTSPRYTGQPKFTFASNKPSDNGRTSTSEPGFH